MVVPSPEPGLVRESTAWSEYDLELVNYYGIKENCLKAITKSGYTSLASLRALSSVQLEDVLKQLGIPLKQMFDIYNLLIHYMPQDRCQTPPDIPMSATHKGVLQTNRDRLIGMIDADQLCDRLFAYHVLTTTDLDKLKSESTQTSQGKVRELLTIIPRKSDGAYALFMQALCDTEQGHVVNMLEQSQYQGVSKGKF